MPRSNYKKSRNTRNSKTSQSRESTDSKFKGKSKECANDPAWYTVSGQLTKDAANLSFNNPSGIQYHLNELADGDFINPGIMNLYMSPTAGYSEGLSSPLNIAAKNIYSWVRHANSGHSNYDSPDLMLYLVGMANAYAYYGWMARIYGSIRVYSQHNRYWGANVVESSGVSASNILSNLANFRAYINQYAIKLSALSVPSTMSLYKRYMWMFSNLFLDENDTKAQIYAYQPAYFYKYDEYNGAGRLVPTPLTTNSTGTASIVRGMTFGDLMTYGDTLLGALIGSEDINIMSGDILKAYGKENCWKLDLITEDYSIAPMFSEEVLAQIHNTVFAGSYPVKDASTPTDYGWDSFMITQDPNIGNGCLICKPLVRRGGATTGNHILDFWKTEITPDDIIVATRNMVCGRRWSQGFTAMEAFASEIPMFAVVWNLKTDGTLDSVSYWDNDTKSDFDGAYTTASAALGWISKIQYFNEHPQFYLVSYNNSSPYASVNAATSVGEMSNFTIVNEEDLEKMHLTAILSMLAVPMLGNIVRG